MPLTITVEEAKPGRLVEVAHMPARLGRGQKGQRRLPAAQPPQLSSRGSSTGPLVIGMAHLKSAVP